MAQIIEHRAPNGTQSDREKALAIMGKRIEGGRASALTVMEHVNTAIPTDRIVPARALQFMPTADGVSVAYDGGKPAPVDQDFGALLAKPVGSGASTERLTRHSFGQVCARAEVPVAYANRLASESADWGRELLAHLLGQHYSHDSAKYLTRSFGGQLRGFLSDSYRRLDSRPLLESFAVAAGEIGAVPIEGHVSETQVAIKAVLPEVFEPVPGEYVTFGIMWKNSDFGNGAHEIAAYVERLLCLNGAVSTSNMRQVHLGKRLSEDMQYSARTYALDTAASASAIGDIVRGSLGPDHVKQRLDVIRLSHEQKINPKEAEAQIKKALGTADTVRVLEAFNSPDVEMMPAGNTAWRLSNAVSWIAGQTQDTDRKIELQRYAGALLAA